jgi:predicted phosphodiesterase
VEISGVKTICPLIKIKIVFICLVAVVVSVIFIGAMGYQHIQVEALQLHVSIQPSLRGGYTELELPPLAVFRANTHATPLMLSIKLENIDPQLMLSMFNKKNSTDLLNTVTVSLRSTAVTLAIKSLILSAAGGAFGVFLWHRKPGYYHLQGALAATMTIGLLMAGTYFTYDTGKFKNPEIDGALKATPWLISLTGKFPDKMDKLSNKMELIAENVSQLFNRLNQLQPSIGNDESVVKVLQVSDVHNNPAALSFIRRIALLFRVDLIIDTGDITDYGTPLEGLILDRLAGLKAPYLFVPGNHDSPVTIKKMGSIPGVTVLNGSVLTVKGLRIMGVPDPSSKTGDIEPPPLEAIPGYAGEIEKSLIEQPDILALHNQRIARLLAGKAPVIMYGHDHRLAVEEKAGSILIDSGSAGASGLRTLQGDKTPYSVVIQYYSPVGGKMKLVDVDTITVTNIGSSFQVDRRFFNSLL